MAARPSTRQLVFSSATPLAFVTHFHHLYILSRKREHICDALDKDDHMLERTQLHRRGIVNARTPISAWLTRFASWTAAYTVNEAKIYQKRQGIFRKILRWVLSLIIASGCEDVMVRTEDCTHLGWSRRFVAVGFRKNAA